MTTLTTLILLSNWNQLPINIQVEGNGYLRFLREGRVVVMKAAILKSHEGKLTNSFGHALIPTIHIGTSSQKLRIDPDGTIWQQSTADTKLGQLILATYPENATLRDLGGVYVCSDKATLLAPMSNGAGNIAITKTTSEIAPKPTPKSTPLPTETTTTLTIKTKTLAQVSAEFFTLADVAEISGPEDLRQKAATLRIGMTPMIGVKTVIERNFLIGKLQSSGINPKSVNLEFGAPIAVERITAKIEGQAFIDCATNALNQSSGIATKYECSETVADYLAPAGKWTLVAEAVTGVNATVASVLVAIYSADPKSTGPIPGFRRINSKTIRFKAIQAPVAVTTGKPVKVVMKAGGARVEVGGIARSSGAVGSQISVEVRTGSPDVKTLHTATVIAIGVVEVQI